MGVVYTDFSLKLGGPCLSPPTLSLSSPSKIACCKRANEDHHHVTTTAREIFALPLLEALSSPATITRASSLIVRIPRKIASFVFSAGRLPTQIAGSSAVPTVAFAVLADRPDLATLPTQHHRHRHHRNRDRRHRKTPVAGRDRFIPDGGERNKQKK